MIKTTIPIEGMHCRSCEIKISQQLEKLPNVRRADVSLKSNEAIIEASTAVSAGDLERAVRAAGYEIGTAKKPWFSKNTTDYIDFVVGLAIIGVLVILYAVFNVGKLLPAGSVSSGGVGVALLTGVAAGLSTCMALVGGLVLGLSARHAKRYPEATTMQKFRPHLLFNVSRIGFFFLFGGIIGQLGASVQLGGAPLGVLMVIVGVVMFLLGLQLTNLMPRVSAGRLTLPTGISRALGLKRHTEKEYSHTSAIALGGISFFLPCGFTQVMQLYAVSTGSFAAGALTMGMFAIGTAPGLLGVGTLTSVVKGKTAGRFFKIAGVAVMVMALINISNGYNLTGFRLPQINLNQAASTKNVDQEVITTVYTLSEDIIPNSFTLKARTKYKLVVNSKDDGQGCMSTIMIPGLFNKPLFLEKDKQQILSFTTKGPGTYKITCAMGISRGTISVI